MVGLGPVALHRQRRPDRLKRRHSSEKCNGAQSLSNAAFNPLVDAGDGLGVEFPFIIAGSVVPEPGTWALMIAGGLAVVGASRRRQQR